MGGTSKSTAVQAMAPMLGTAGQRQQDMLDLMEKTPPDKERVSQSALDDIIQRTAILNDYRTKAAEAETNPVAARLRASYDKDLESTYENAKSGNLPVGVNNALVKAGLAAAMRGSGGVAGSSGQGTAARVFGSGANDYVDRIRSMIANYLQGTAKPVVGLDASSAGNLAISNIKDNQNLENSFRQQLLGATLNANNNMTNLANSYGQAAAMQANSNLAGRNAAGGQALGAMVGLAGAGAAAY